MKKIKTILICVAFFIAFALPVGLVISLSQAEKREYEPIAGYSFSEEYAYGSVVTPTRMTMAEYMSVSGVYAGYQDIFVDLSDYDGLFLSVDEGDEVALGQEIGFDRNGNTLLAESNAVVTEINRSEGYIRMTDLNEVALECYVSVSYADLLSQMSGSLTDENGDKVELLFRSVQIRSDGTVFVRLKTGTTGEIGKTGSFKLYTGTVYSNVLAVKNNCLYRNNSGDWCVRKTLANGVVVGEQMVGVGYSDGEYTMITAGIDENTLLDSGAASYYGE